MVESRGTQVGARVEVPAVVVRSVVSARVALLAAEERYLRSVAELVELMEDAQFATVDGRVVAYRGEDSLGVGVDVVCSTE